MENNQYWSSQNPYLTHEALHHSVKVGVWRAISARRIVGPVFFKATINCEWYVQTINLINLHSGGVESKLGPLGMSATRWPIVPAPGDCEDGEFGGMNGRGNWSTRRKPAPTPLFPPQIPLDQTRDWTRAAKVGSQQLTASAMVRPCTDHSRANLSRMNRRRNTLWLVSARLSYCPHCMYVFAGFVQCLCGQNYQHRHLASTFIRS
jgi:hypothetical protein